jgi:hypothetical protein
LNNGLHDYALYEAHIAKDILMLIECDAIYMLSDWESSKGAMIEKFVAQFSDKKIIYEN